MTRLANGTGRFKTCECELVREFVRGASADRRVEGGIQRRAAAQQFGICGPGNVRTAKCSAAVASGSLRAQFGERNEARVMNSQELNVV